MTDQDRLRPPPKDRLAAPLQRVDLAEAAARLRSEAHPAVAGHRQIALARHGPVSLILFVFDKEGYLKEHRASGEVVIQVLSGRLSVTVATEELTLGAGQVVTLAPGLVHSVRALEASDMLLTLSRTAPA